MSPSKKTAKRLRPSKFATLPTELLVEIFRFAVLDFMVDRKKLLFTFGAVCGRFRKVAWGCKDLWKVLKLRFSCHEVPEEPRPLLVREWLERSGTSLLDLTLDIDKFEPGTADRAIRLLIVLLRECRRWNSLALQGESAQLLCNELVENDYIFPALTVLAVHDSVEPSNYGPTLEFKEAKIQNITVNAEEWTVKHFKLNWAFTRTIDLYGQFDDVCSFLPYVASHVQRATICPTTMPEGFFQVTRLPALHTLELGSDEAWEHGDILNDNNSLVTVLEVPSLQDLTINAFIDLSGECYKADFSQLSAMIQRSQCQLVRLELFNVVSSTRDIVRVLENVPTLEHLDLATVETQLSDRFFKALTPSTRSTIIILPRITSIIYYGGLSAQPSAIVSFARSRTVGVPATLSPGSGDGELKRLETLKIHCQDVWLKEKDPNDVISFNQDILSFSNHGLEFSMTYDTVD